MQHTTIEEKLRQEYQAVATQYRSDDEAEILTENHRRLGDLLRKICRSLKRPLTVLDVGCGTGRYFHCLINVATLMGMDLSPDMLAAAHNPVRRGAITANQVELRVGNIYLTAFAPETFDFIYSIGMFGHGASVTSELCSKFYNWLRPGGKLFFDVVDVEGLPLVWRAHRRLRQVLYPLAARFPLRGLVPRANGSGLHCLNHEELQARMAATRFEQFTIASQICESHLWNGRHLECLAVKTERVVSDQ